MWMLHTATRWTLVSMAGLGMVPYVDQKVPLPREPPTPRNCIPEYDVTCGKPAQFHEPVRTRRATVLWVSLISRVGRVAV